MGHSGDPKTADSQFYILLGNRPELDAKYTVFGRVIRGMDVLERIQRADVLRKATVRERTEAP
jgi:cyclophilin family peptidyl-prolyl cis-trans isomerase